MSGQTLDRSKSLIRTDKETKEIELLMRKPPRIGVAPSPPNMLLCPIVVALIMVTHVFANKNNRASRCGTYREKEPLDDVVDSDKVANLLCCLWRNLALFHKTTIQVNRDC